ncbi:MAG TPA: Holliday junction branch migration protein RuvA [Stellaceae bacterium]|nr:Holliday junction branch migration protein RuvA [Stellaceae bacterium]
MIASLSGIVEQVTADSVVVDVGGVGYLVFAASRTLARLPTRGEPVRLLIETHVREDHIHLYGFADEAERGWFRLLTTVQGVGAKTALAVLSALTSDALTAAVMAQDKAALTEADGVGRKLAQRIVIELRDKLGAVALEPIKLSDDRASGGGTVAGDAVSALVNLGYPRTDAFAAVSAAARALGSEARLDALVKASLKELAL